MARDAPIPPDVARVTLGWQTGDRFWTTSHWLLMSDAAGHTNEWAAYFLQQLHLDVTGQYLEVMHSGTSASTCRLLVQGFSYFNQPPADRGSYQGGQSNGTVVGLHWLTENTRGGARALTHLSGVPDVFISGNDRLSVEGFQKLTHAASGIWSGLQLLPGPLGAPCTPVTLRRRTKGGPLDVAIADPIVGTKASYVVSTMRRRLPKTGRAPLFQ